MQEGREGRGDAIVSQHSDQELCLERPCSRALAKRPCQSGMINWSHTKIAEISSLLLSDIDVLSHFQAWLLVLRDDMRTISTLQYMLLMHHLDSLMLLARFGSSGYALEMEQSRLWPSTCVIFGVQGLKCQACNRLYFKVSRQTA